MCLDPDDLRQFKVDCQPIEICCSDDEIQNALDMALEIANRFTGQQFCPITDCRIFSGTGSDKLFLTGETSLPLANLESVTIIGSGAELDVSEIRNHAHFIEWVRCFPCGRNNIRVCGEWGKELPVGVRHAVLLLALEMLQPGNAGLANPGGVTRADWEDFSISYRVDETFNELRPTTGFREIDNLLLNYMNTAAVVGVHVVPDNDRCIPKNCGKITRGLGDTGGYECG